MKTIPFTAAHTHIAHIWQYPPGISDFLSSCVLAAEKMYAKSKEVMFLGDLNIDMLTEKESSVG